MRDRIIGMGLLAVLMGVVVPAQAALVTVTGQGNILNPAVVPTGALADFFQDTGDKVLIHGWNEKQSVTLGRDIVVDITKPGTYAKVFHSENAEIEEGTVVSSHLIFFDPKQGAARKATFTFDQNIIGVIVLSNLKESQGGDRLLKTDFLGNPLTIYPTKHFTNRGIEFGPEKITLMADLRSLEVDLSASSPGDQIRVLTMVPTPAAAWAGLSLAGVIVAVRGYRRFVA